MESAMEGGGSPDRTLPWGVAAISGVVLLVLLAVLTARLTGFEPAQPSLGAVVDSRTLGFRDLSGGFVEIFDWDSGENIDRIGPGEGSFLRGVMRSLVRQRRGEAIGAGAPFTLTRYSDGRLMISDPSTGESIDLVAFGPDNAAVFAQLLAASAADSTPVYPLD
jgi:putative photosynthetic complex assembly protein